jgi:hypothetical protein
MDFSKLSDQEIKALLMQYDSELRKLNFQIQVVQNTIQQLHQQLSGIPVSTPQILNTNTINTKVENHQESIEKIEEKAVELDETKEVEVKKEIKREYPPKKVVKREYPPKNKKKRRYTKNSPWPDFILKQFELYGHVLSSKQIYDFGIDENKIKKYESNDKTVRGLISRAIHTLANKKNKIVKLDNDDGRGYNYAPIEWLDENGKIPEKYIPK